jgi:hypothetical protein
MKEMKDEGIAIIKNIKKHTKNESKGKYLQQRLKSLKSRKKELQKVREKLADTIF